ncbi:DUF1517 domain-containing protein [Leptolyngbya sp. PCC 6406]|uniref:DUF1517 domain-containing protein n=1 Tax=Leptolyngbya sp. PCC 6406 TaxID=1173264 RepID=UPI0002ACD334|nr:DUF1517 domain-containing protein [Leptolyngbya sp. PCC 6406]
MVQKFFSPLKSLMALALAAVLVFGHADSALAARGGGRIGGGGFRTPSRTLTQPRSYRSPAGGGYYPGGGFGFPFLIPLFGFGGGFGGLFGILLFLGLANFLVNALRNFRGGEGETESYNPSVTVSQLQIGLLAEARSLQEDLNRMALSADTSSAQGLTQVLQEASLALLRHPEYWHYAAASTQRTGLASAEQTFNQLALGERSKFSAETLSNVNSQIQQGSVQQGSVQTDGATAALIADGDPGEYIVATVIVATQGKLELPRISGPQEVRQALSQLGAVASDRLLAVEILWTPQVSGETLTADEMVAAYPSLTLI